MLSRLRSWWRARHLRRLGLPSHFFDAVPDHLPDVERAPDRERRWQQKQALAKPARYYGDGGTVHDSTSLDVEVDAIGNVGAVWFRCQPLPFTQSSADAGRTAEMQRVYAVDRVQLTGVEVLDVGKVADSGARWREVAHK